MKIVIQKEFKVDWTSLFVFLDFIKFIGLIIFFLNVIYRNFNFSNDSAICCIFIFEIRKAEGNLPSAVFYMLTPRLPRISKIIANKTV